METRKIDSNNTHVNLIFLSILVLIFIALLSFYLYSKKTRSITSIPSPTLSPKLQSFGPFPSSTPLPTPTPRSISHGKKRFQVSQGDRNIPLFGSGEINPYDPALGAEQSVIIDVAFADGVDAVSVLVQTDNKDSGPYSLALVSGTKKRGQWKGSWKMNDSYLYIYALTLKAESTASASTVQIALR